MSAKTVTVAARLGFAVLGLAVATAAFGTQSTDHAAGGGANTAAAAQPAAKADAAKPADDDAAKITKGRELFSTWGCESCHALGDAGASGHVGPAFDGNPNLTKEFIVNRVTNGQGPMPAFGGQMSDEEIAGLADYILMVAQK